MHQFQYDAGDGGGGNDVGGGGPADDPIAGVPGVGVLGVFDEPIHRAVDFLPGVDRRTRVLDPARLSRCDVALPSDGGDGGFVSREGSAHGGEAARPRSGDRVFGDRETEGVSTPGGGSRGASRGDGGGGVHLAFGSRFTPRGGSAGSDAPGSRGGARRGGGGGGGGGGGSRPSSQHLTPRGERRGGDGYGYDLNDHFGRGLSVGGGHGGGELLVEPMYPPSAAASPSARGGGGGGAAAAAAGRRGGSGTPSRARTTTTRR